MSDPQQHFGIQIRSLYVHSFGPVGRGGRRLVKNGSSGFPNHESIYSDCHRPSFAPSFRLSPTDRERGRVISPPSLSLPRLTPSARKLELSDLRIADQVQFFPAALSRERREVRKKEDKHPFIVEWVPRTTDAVHTRAKPTTQLLP